MTQATVAPITQRQWSALHRRSDRKLAGMAIQGTVLAVAVTSQVSAVVRPAGVPESVANPIAGAVVASTGTSILVISDAEADGAFAGTRVGTYVPEIIAASVAGYPDAVRVTLAVGAFVILAAAGLARRLPQEG